MARERIDYKWYEREKERKAVVEDYSLSPFDDEGHHTINYCIIENNPPKSVFISYSSKDGGFVKKLTDHLKNAGVIVWLDKDEINIGDSLTDKIGEALTHTDYICAILSQNSINSNWAKKELHVAYQRELSGELVILPILLEAVEIPPFLRGKKYADFSTPDKFDSALADLLKVLL